jgi:hypothetical protein
LPFPVVIEKSHFCFLYRLCLHFSGALTILAPLSPLAYSPQGHTGSRVKVGDYLYYGLGVAPDHEAAADEYRSAADANDAQAMFNLGLMHHLGDGLEQDIHLAKRFYDMALRTSVDAKVPASIALYLLYGSFAKEWLETALMPTIKDFLVLPPGADIDVEAFVRVSWLALVFSACRCHRWYTVIHGTHRVYSSFLRLSLSISSPARVFTSHLSFYKRPQLHKTAIIIAHVVALVFLALTRQLSRHRAQERERRELETLERARLQAEYASRAPTTNPPAEEVADDAVDRVADPHEDDAIEGAAVIEGGDGDGDVPDGLRHRRPVPTG